jgi:tetratricopeptide (TPR) repeat protein
MAPAEPQSLDRDNPWPGLMPFTEAAQEFFHGREDAVAELARRVRRALLTVLFGKSGLGKTSLLNAGLFPLLRASDFLPIYLRLDFVNPARSPIDQIAGALTDSLAAHQVEGRAPEPGETLWGFLHDKETEFWNRRNRLVTPVLVFDQFEEIFTLGQNGPAAEAIVAELAALIENRPPEQLREALERDPETAGRYDFAKEACKVIITLREDFLPELEGLQDQIPSIMNNRVRLGRMNGLQAREVILRSGGHLVGDGVAERIIAFVAASREREPPAAEGQAELARLDIEPALLSIICRELNTKRLRAGQDKITTDLLDGAQNEIVADFYNSSLAGLDPAVQVFIEDELLTASGYRDSRPLADALMVPGVTRAAIDLLVGRRLLRIEERFGTQWIELTHDLLTEVIRQQRDTRRETQEGEAQRERAERAEAEAAAQAELAREAAEREQAAHRLVRRTRFALAVTLATLIAAVGAMVFAYSQRREALVAEQAAQQEERDLRVVARRSHQQLVNHSYDIKNFAESLAEARPAGATIWPHSEEASALDVLGDHAAAIRQEDAVLEVKPDNISALGSRGYDYLLIGKPKEALADFKKYLEFGPNPTEYSNVAIAEAMLGHYHAAIEACENAIKSYHPYRSDVFDSEVAPEIQLATRNTILTADGPTFLSALRYTLAVLHGFAGDPEFEAALQAADAADPNFPNASDAYLLALNWSWLIVRVQPGELADGPADYGVFAATGALWERMGAVQSRYYDWARQYYQKFETAYRARPSPKYAGLARFVAERLERKEIRDAVASAPEPPEPGELADEAEVAELNQSSENPLSYAEGERLLSAAIAILQQGHPERSPQTQEQLMRLYLRRAQLRLDAQDSKGSRDDVERVLAIDPRMSEAYRLRAHTDLVDEARRRDYQRAVDENPFNSGALDEFSDWLRQSDPAQALQLQQRRMQLVNLSSADYEGVARLQLQLGKSSDALRSVETAIEMAPYRVALYELRGEIERAAGTPEPKVRLGVLGGYRAAADDDARSGTDGTAISLYARAIQGIVALQDANPSDADVGFEFEASIRSLSHLLESRFGATYAAQFWRDFAPVGASPQSKGRIASEAERLSASP